MIVFVTTRHHGYTVRPLVEDTFGPPVPHCRQMSWEDLWRADYLPRATFVLIDLERLTPHERRMGAEAYRAITGAGLRCLNDPARIPTRHALLSKLHALGINPFRSWRADEAVVRPNRFPVFLRQEDAHDLPVSGLIHDQPALDAAIADLVARGYPLTNVLAVEFCAEPIAPDTWRRFGSFRIGSAIHTDHAVIEAHWVVKSGTYGATTDAMAEEEHVAVRDGTYAAALRPVFDAAAVEFGRCDHARANGRDIFFEINTNPTLSGPFPQRLPRRAETLEIARAHLARALAEVDSGDGGSVRVEHGKATLEWRDRSFACFAPWRP
jgi:hypothetical protein